MLRDLPKEDREALRIEFLKQAQKQFDRMFDAGEQSNLITLDQREGRAIAIGKHLAQWALQQHLAQDQKAATILNQSAACPKCGRTCLEKSSPDGSVPERSAVTGAGSVTMTRPEFSCPLCRRAFFPPGSGTQPVRRRLQRERPS